MKKIIFGLTIIFGCMGFYFYGERRNIDKFNVPIDYSHLDNIRIDYKFKNNIFEINSSNYRIIDRDKKVHFGSKKNMDDFFNTGNFKIFSHTIESFTLYMFVETKLNDLIEYKNCRKKVFFTIIIDVENNKSTLYCKNHQGEDFSQDIVLVKDKKNLVLYRVILENYFKSIEH